MSQPTGPHDAGPPYHPYDQGGPQWEQGPYPAQEPLSYDPYGYDPYGYQVHQGYPGHPGHPGFPVGNGKATASLVIGVSTLVLSWCCGFGVLGALAVALGVKARREIRMSQHWQTGDGLALAGIVTGAVAVLFGLAALVLVVAALVSGGGGHTRASFGTYA